MYNKIFTKILDSSIWLEPDATRLVWLTLIAGMDEDGFCQFASVANLAHRARVSLKAATAAVATLEGPDVNSSDPDFDGRRIERAAGGWIVLNAAKYRELVTRVVQRERTRERVRKHRATKSNDTETGSNASVTPANDTLLNVTSSEVYTEAYTEAEGERQRRSAPIARRRNLNAAYEGPRGLYVLQGQHQKFLDLHNGAVTEAELFTWYELVAEEWATGARKAEQPDANLPKFWDARFAERWPPTKAIQSVAVAPTYTEWRCPHVDRCSNREQCRNASILGRPERQAS